MTLVGMKHVAPALRQAKLQDGALGGAERHDVRMLTSRPCNEPMELRAVTDQVRPE